MKYDKLCEELKDKVPSIADIIDANCDMGNHFVFFVITDSYILNADIVKDEEVINQLFAFFETMANSNISAIEEVLEFSVLETIWDCEDKNKINKYYSFLGDKTKEFWNNIKKNYGLE